MVFLTMTIPLLTAALLLFVLADQVEAYVDPGTGSMLMQLLLGGIMAVLVLLRSSWERVCGWFHRRPTIPSDKAK